MGAESLIHSLSQKVFGAIASRYRHRVKDIGRFAIAALSFEEWLNWEAFAACSEVRTWGVVAKPRYCLLGLAGCKDFGDLLVTSLGQRVLVEIGLVHEGTGNKWREKLEGDARKLARPLTNVKSMHIIILVSSSSIDDSSEWQRWLAKTQCWCRPTKLEFSSKIPPAGQMLVRGWSNALK